MTFEPWLDDLSEDWGDDAEDARSPPQPHDVGAAGQSLRASRRPEAGEPGLLHRHSSSAPSLDALPACDWAPRRSRDRGFTVDASGARQRPPQVNTARRRAVAVAGNAMDGQASDERPATGEATQEQEREREKCFIHDDYDLDDMWDEGGSVVQHGQTAPDAYGTTQIKARRTPTTHDTETIPEWKRRLMKGEKINDLFIQKSSIESLFDAPPGQELHAQYEDLGLSKRLASMSLEEQTADARDVDRRSTASIPSAALAKGCDKIKEEQSSRAAPQAIDSNDFGNRVASHDSRVLTDSGMSDLRNEAMTPIPIHVEGATPTLVQDAMKATPSKAEQHLAPTNAAAQAGPGDEAEDAFEITCHSLPADLSMGTPDLGITTSRAKFEDNDRPTKHAGKPKSKLRTWTRPTTPISPQLKPSISASSVVSNPKTRTSPHGGSPMLSALESQHRNPGPSPKSLQSKSEEIIRPQVRLSQEVTRPNSMPLRLFGNHDTFTNNKLLRRLSQLDIEGDTGGHTRESALDAMTQQVNANQCRGRGHVRGQSAPDISFVNQNNGGPALKQAQVSDEPLRRRARSKTTLPSLTPPPPSPPTHEMRRIDLQFRPRTAMSDRSRPQHPVIPARLSSRQTNRAIDSSPERSPDASPAKSPTPIPRRQKSGRPATPLRDARSPEIKRVLYSPAKASTPKRRRTSTKVSGSTLWESPIINATPFKSKSRPASRLKNCEEDASSPTIRDKSLKCVIPTPLCRELSDDSSPSGDSKTDDAEMSHSFEVLKQRYGDKFREEFVRLSENRKGSITTGDFLQEATKVMDFIRAKGKVRGTPGLASVSEDDGNVDGPGPAEEAMAGGDEASEADEPPAIEQCLRPVSRNAHSEASQPKDLRRSASTKGDQGVLSHLQQFADDSEAEQLDLSPSVSSLHLASSRHRMTAGIKERETGRSEKLTHRKHKRLLENRLERVKREGSSGSMTAGPADIRARERSRNQSVESLSANSQRSFNSQAPGGSGRSQVSNAGARGLIPGDKVSHLIPKSVGSMVLDQSKRQWIRDQSRPSSRQQEQIDDDERHGDHDRLGPETPPNEQDDSDLHTSVNMEYSRMSEDDPFRDISDLSVDEAEELNMICSPFDSRPGNFKPGAVRKAVGGDRPQGAVGVAGDDDTCHPTLEPTAAPSRGSARDGGSGLGIDLDSASPAPAPVPRALQARLEPRETSWGSDLTGTTRRSETRTSSSYFSGASGSRNATNNSSASSYQSKSDRASQATAVGSAHEAEPDRSGGLDQCGASYAPAKSAHPDKQARVVTITVQSPSKANQQQHKDRRRSACPKWKELVETGEMTQGQDSVPVESNSPLKANLKASAIDRRGYDKENERTTLTPEKVARFAPGKSAISHPPSFQRRDFKGRPISRIEEEQSAEESMLLQGNELSIIPTGHQGGDAGVQQPESAVPTPEKSYSFHLNTLPEFTLHQVDEQDTELGTVRREVSFVGRRTHPTSLKPLHGKLSVASEQLIRSITDVHENEVYWDRIRQLNLAGKQIIGTHALEKLCPRLEELDLSRNQLSQTIGIPEGVRMLGLRHNYLNDLTAWGHLKNLQYLDVSNNELESLDAFACMVHLRSLKASNNRITRLGEIVKLDGLLALHLRGNELLEVDFAGTAWKRMTALDLRENHIQRVRHLGCLTSLEKLDVSNNDLCSFGDDTALPRLRTLKISQNMLTDLDTTGFPELRLLYADGNNLRNINGLAHCRRLEALSLREQVPADARDQSPLTVDLDVSCVAGLRKLHLSGNRLGKHVLRPRKPIPGLQLLDVSCCGLETLPADLGHKFPSLRALNLNFNALSDLSGLVGITRLIRFLAAGNRISGLRSICQILKEIGGRHGSLRCVDLRGNPMTVGFYPVASMAAADPKSLALQRKPSAFEPNANGVDENKVKDPYALPLMDSTTDDRYVRRLDDGTRTRRRVVHCLINVSAGSRLKLLDGLDVSNVDPIGLLEDAKERRGGGEDDVWRRLIELGVVRKKRSADSAVSGVLTDVTGSTETIATGPYDGSGSELGGRRSRQRVE